MPRWPMFIKIFITLISLFYLNTASADIGNIQKLLTEMNCKPGSVDGVWGKRSNAAYEGLMRKTKRPIATCMPECSESVELALNELKRSGNSCDSLSLNDRSSTLDAVRKQLNSCGSWESEIVESSDDEFYDFLDKYEVEITAEGSGNKLFVSKNVRIFNGRRPYGTSLDYVIARDDRLVTNSIAQMDNLNANYSVKQSSRVFGGENASPGNLNNNVHFVELHCKDGSDCFATTGVSITRGHEDSFTSNPGTTSALPPSSSTQLAFPVCSSEVAQNIVRLMTLN